jgi:rRNA processing protein Gar1
MCLQRLGKVLHVTPSQNVVVKADKTPKIGSAVDVIGPVPSPYVVVKPAVKELGKIGGKQLYLLLSKKQRSKKHE